MIDERLNDVLDNTDTTVDRPSWSRFCDWLSSFHDVDTNKLTKYKDFSAFEKNAEIVFPLKYLESIKDLWIKWNKAVESDRIR